MTDKPAEKPTWDQMTINGVPALALSEAGQQIFQKVLALKEETDQLSRQFDQKQAALRELSDLILAEVQTLKKAEESSEATTEASV